MQLRQVLLDVCICSKWTMHDLGLIATSIAPLFMYCHIVILNVAHLSILAAGIILALISVCYLVAVLPPPTKCDSEEKSDTDNCLGQEVR